MMTNIKIHSLLVFLVLAAVTETVRGDESQQHAMVVISSTEAAALIWPEILGQYEYDEEKECYVQSSTEQRNKEYTARYLYRDEDDVWVVGPSPNGDSGFWMFNINSTNLTTGDGDWFVTFNGTLYFDPSITVTPGPLPPLPSQFVVTASSSGEYAKISDSLEDLGVFTKTERWWAGRPVYMNTQGHFLYHGLQSWVIGPKLGYFTLIGSKSYKSPADVKNWTFNEVTTYGGQYLGTSSGVEKPASITVLEATHPNLVRYNEDRKGILDQHLKKRQYENSSVGYSYSYDNSGIIIAVISVILTVLGAIFGVIRCIRKHSKVEEATQPNSQPPRNVAPTNQVDNSSVQPQPHHPIQSLRPGQDQMNRAMAPTPYSVNQSWNTRSGRSTPYSIHQ